MWLNYLCRQIYRHWKIEYVEIKALLTVIVFKYGNLRKQLQRQYVFHSVQKEGENSGLSFTDYILR
jgi:hypothetical protein